MLNLKREAQVKSQLLQVILSQRLPEGYALPSIRTLARQLGTSTLTIQKAIDRLKTEGLIESRPGAGLFVKTLLARAPRRRRIGCFFAGKPEYLQENPYPGKVMDALRSRLAEAGYELTLHGLASADPLAWTDAFSGLKLGGVVLFEIDSGFILRDLQELRLPVVSMDFDCSRLGIPSVTFDNHVGAIEMTNHLIEQGHRRVAYIQAPFVRRFGVNAVLDAVASERYEGYRIAMRMAGLEPIKLQLPDDAYAAEDLAEVVFAQAEKTLTPTAFLCPSFKPANRLAGDLIRKGLAVPETFSVAAFGNPDRNFDGERSLSSVWLDYEGMGDTAARMLISILQSGSDEPNRCVLPTRLEIRDSVAPPARTEAARLA